MTTNLHDLQRTELSLDLDGVTLAADLTLPPAARGVILFAHGGASGRASPRAAAVAKVLHRAGLATVLADLLTPEEVRADAESRRLRFDIPRLARRLMAMTVWLRRDSETLALPVGYFGASSGAAAALVAAAGRADVVRAVVSRGGRPDLAGAALREVRAPTLLIVGGFDEPTIDVNRDALRCLQCVKQLEIVPRATHLFEEPGALHHVAELAVRWFDRHLIEPPVRCLAAQTGR